MYLVLTHLLLVKLLVGVSILLLTSAALVGAIQGDSKMAKELFIDSVCFMAIAIVAMILHRL